MSIDDEINNDLYAPERKELSHKERLLVDFLLFSLITFIGIFTFIAYRLNLINKNTDVTVDPFIPGFIIGIVLFLYSVNLIISAKNYLNHIKVKDIEN